MLYSYDMWFEPTGGMMFKLTISSNDAHEMLELARLNWDYNVNTLEYRAISARP